MLAEMLCDRNDTKVLTTRLEHHANDLPWRDKAKVYYCNVDEMGKINLDEIEEKLHRAKGTIKYVTVAGASNVTGYILPIHKIAELVHHYGARMLVDGAQLVAHREINIKGETEDEALDALIFSGHKMYAPFGSGVIVVKEELLEGKKPFLLGGGTVEAVFDDDVY